MNVFEFCDTTLVKYEWAGTFCSRLNLMKRPIIYCGVSWGFVRVKRISNLAVLFPTALQNHNLWPFRTFFVTVWWWKFELEIRTGTRSDRRPKLAIRLQLKKTWPVLHHWSKAPRIRGCRAVLNSIVGFRFTAVGWLRSHSRWSWVFRIACVNLHDCEVAPLTSQTLERANFSLTSQFDRFAFEFWPRTFAIGCYGNRSD